MPFILTSLLFLHIYGYVSGIIEKNGSGFVLTGFIFIYIMLISVIVHIDKRNKHRIPQDQPKNHQLKHG